ncbi:MAG: ATP-binding protein [Microcoleaceae cyanobacterium]
MSSLVTVISMDNETELKSHKFIQYFERDEAEKLCAVAEIKEYIDQDIIFDQGDYPDSLYLVLQGKVEFVKPINSGQYQTIATAQKNDYFGEFGVLDGQPRSARAVAIESTKLAKISHHYLLEVLKNAKGSVTLKLFGTMSQSLRKTTNQYVNQVAHKEKMEILGEMVSTILHDFRSPFTGIQLASSMMKETHLDQETQEWCELITMQIQRMLNMAEEVIAFSKGSATLKLMPIRLEDIIKKFEKLNRIYFQSNQVYFSAEVDPEIIIKADNDKLIRVIQNLVTNAVEAFDQSGGFIHIQAQKYQNWAQITIQDNGPGIPETIQDQLFEAFVTYGKHSGTGLGTAIVKSIIEAHHGEIKFISIPNEGTTFKILLPLTEINDSQHVTSETIPLER